MEISRRKLFRAAGLGAAAYFLAPRLQNVFAATSSITDDQQAALEEIVGGEERARFYEFTKDNVGQGMGF